MACQSALPGSLFWMCHQSMVTGSPPPPVVSAVDPAVEPAVLGGVALPDEVLSAAPSSLSLPHAAAVRARTEANARTALRRCRVVMVIAFPLVYSGSVGSCRAGGRCKRFQQVGVGERVELSSGPRGC